MKYFIDGTLVAEDAATELQRTKPYVAVVSAEEYFDKYKELADKIRLFDVDDIIRHSKVYITANSFYGTVQKPQRGELEDKTCFFYADKNRLIFVEKEGNVSDYILKIVDEQIIEAKTPPDVLFMFLDELIDTEGINLDKLQDELDEREAKLINKNVEIDTDFDHGLHTRRHELMELTRHYKQIANLCILLAECPYDIIEDETGKLFRYLSERAERLNGDARDLQEYAIQLRELYESDITNKQNKIMKTLTIVTTIFMPLTLLTGWYGMNFKYMPELGHEYGYFAVIVIAMLILTVELIIYNKNRWMD